jgi:galactonate dehydratase
MTITEIETVHIADIPQTLFVLIHTSDGLTGIGETNFGVENVSAYIHNEVAEILLGRNPLEIELIWYMLYKNGRAFLSRGTEIRALSAVDIALWDIFGKAVSMPVYQLLGGRVRERLPIYNTCAGPAYGVSVKGQTKTGSYQLSPAGNLEDLRAFLTDAGSLAEELLGEGINCMKIWPFDQFSEEANGQHISLENLNNGLEPFRKIRKAVGDRMEVALEMHCLWNLPTAIRIAKAVEEYRPLWFEDPIGMDAMSSLSEFRHSTRIPTAASETLSTRFGFRDLLEHQGAGIIMADVGWGGGISEAKKIAAMADAYRLPFAPHDCVGPVVLMASIHLCFNLTNAFVQETVRAYLRGWYRDIVDFSADIRQGFVYPPASPGLGVELRPDVFKRPDVTVRKTSAKR